MEIELKEGKKLKLKYDFESLFHMQNNGVSIADEGESDIDKLLTIIAAGLMQHYNYIDKEIPMSNERFLKVRETLLSQLKASIASYKINTMKAIAECLNDGIEEIKKEIKEKGTEKTKVKPEKKP